MTTPTRVRVLKAEDPEEIAKNFAVPHTAGEEAADRPSQVAMREAIDQQRALEREQVVWYSIFHAYGTSRARQLEASYRLDAIEAELNLLRPMLAGSTQRVAKTSTLAKLDAALRTDDVKKSSLPDPFALSNSIGLRTQPKVK